MYLKSIPYCNNIVLKIFILPHLSYMKKLLIFVSLIIALPLFFVCCTEAKSTSTPNETAPINVSNVAVDTPQSDDKAIPISGLEIPKTAPKDKIISHYGYTLLLNATHKQATWVAYELSKEETTKQVDRTNKFIADPKANSEIADNQDYAGSGYDRGHLAPAGDMSWSATSMEESFYYSNMSPQQPSFNRGIWKKLEERVRTWAIENSALYIVTGPILTAGLSTIGEHQISVPKYYYKVILDYTEPELKGIGFIIPNKGSQDSLQAYTVSIDSVERATGIDFFPGLPDNQEKTIERSVCKSCWSWSTVTSRSATSATQNASATTAQCSGTTKAGNRCKRMTTNASGMCSQHE